MPKAVKLESRRLSGEMCGCGCGQPLPPFEAKGATEYDHRPSLMNRRWNARKRDWEPAANDPRYIRPLLPKCHKAATFGPGGEKRITTRGGDIGEKAHERSMRDKHQTFVNIMEKKKPGRKRTPKGSIQSRGFSKEKRGFAPRRI